MQRAAFLGIGLAVSLSGCATPPAPDAQGPFFARLTSLCGQSFAGRMVSNEAADADMAGADMIAYVAYCDEREIRIPFHVVKADGSWDRSRTWIITRTPTGLRLKHDHRHADGSPDAVTFYGGDTQTPGTISRQEFAVDAESIALFQRTGLPKSVTNVWAMEISDRNDLKPVLAYELRRSGTNTRFFRVEFDFNGAAPVPPPAWGQEPD